MATTAAAAFTGTAVHVPGVQLPCPQCGALLHPPHRVDTFTCPWCGSTLYPGGGLRIFHLAERPRLDKAEAEEVMWAWFSGPDTPRDLEKEVSAELGELQVFPYLRRRGGGHEVVAPLAPLPQPELLDLPAVPADLEQVGPSAEGGSKRFGGGREAGASADEETLRDALRAAAAEPAVREAIIEERAYYPVRYTYRGERFTAVVPAGGGDVLAYRRPARREVVGERGLALGTSAILLAEALALPGLFVKLVAVSLTAVALFPLLRWLVVARL